MMTSMEPRQEADNFASELLWCINQLETGLHMQSPSSRQAQETVRLIRILRSTKAPMVKKRQVMRNALGDYRKKMKDGEKKSFKAMKHSRFQSSVKCKGHSKSRFLRQSHTKQDSHSYNTNLSTISLSKLSLGAQQDPDSYGAQDPIVCNVSSTSKEDNKVHTNTQTDSAKLLPLGNKTTGDSDSVSSTLDNPMFRYVPSDNSFLFGFPADESDDSEHLSNSNSENRDESIQTTTSSTNNDTQSHHSVDMEVQKNYFNYEKSNNEFSFGFNNC